MPKRAVNIALIDSPIAIEIFDDIVKNEYIVPSTFAGLTFAQTISIGITTKMLTNSTTTSSPIENQKSDMPHFKFTRDTRISGISCKIALRNIITNTKTRKLVFRKNLKSPDNLNH